MLHPASHCRCRSSILKVAETAGKFAEREFLHD